MPLDLETSIRTTKSRCWGSCCCIVYGVRTRRGLWYNCRASQQKKLYTWIARSLPARKPSTVYRCKPGTEVRQWSLIKSSLIGDQAVIDRWSSRHWLLIKPSMITHHWPLIQPYRRSRNHGIRSSRQSMMPGHPSTANIFDWTSKDTPYVSPLPVVQQHSIHNTRHDCHDWD